MRVLLGLEMYLRVVQVEERRLVHWGKSWEIWREQRDLWMNWSIPAPLSSNNSLNIKTIRDILYMHLNVCLHLFCNFCFVTNSHLMSAVVSLDRTLHIGLCDVPGHPLHRQSQRPDRHCCQGSCWDQVGGARHSRGENTSLFKFYRMFLFPLLTFFGC